MKKILSILALTCLAVALVACSGNSATVKVAKEFATAYYSGDFEAYNAMMEEPQIPNELQKALHADFKKNTEEYQYLFTYDKERSTFTDAEANVWFKVTSKTHPEFARSGDVLLKQTEAGNWVVVSNSLPRN